MTICSLFSLEQSLDHLRYIQHIPDRSMESSRWLYFQLTLLTFYPPLYLFVINVVIFNEFINSSSWSRLKCFHCTWLLVSNESRLQTQCGDDSLALLEIENALSHTLHAFGEDHPVSLYVLGTLAKHCEFVGNFSRSMELCTKLSTLQSRTFGETSMECMWTKMQ